MPVEQDKGKFDFDVVQDVNIIWTDNNHPPTIVDGSPVEDDLGYNVCKEPYMVYADVLDDARRRNDVNSRWRTGDSVTFTLKKDGVATAYTPTAVQFVNEANAYYTTIEWRDVLDLDGVGCYVLESNSTIAGIAQPMIILGTFQLMHYEIDNIIQAQGTARMLSQFNDVNDKVGIDFTDSKVLDSIRVSGKFGYFNDLTEVDNIEYLDGEMQKIKREDFTEYELRLNLSAFCFIEPLRFHLLSENSCWMSDYNFNSYFYYDDIPVIVKEGLAPEHFDDSRSIKGVCKFEDKVRRSRTHFHNNRKTAEDNAAPKPCLPVNITDGEDTLSIPSGGSYTCVSGSPGSKSAKLMPSGAIASYAADDDFAQDSGRDIDWYDLNYTNFFGHIRRFTGTTGGYHNGTTFVDVNGTPTTEALAFPDTIALDWSTYEDSTGDVLGWGTTINGGIDTATRNWATAKTAALATSLGAFTTGWRMSSAPELFSIFNFGAATFNYEPFMFAVYFVWTSTSLQISTTFKYRSGSNDARMLYDADTALRNFMPCRTFNTSEL